MNVSRAFEYFILATIFANCVALAIYTPYPNNDSDKVNNVLVCILQFDRTYCVENGKVRLNCVYNTIHESRNLKEVNKLTLYALYTYERVLFLLRFYFPFLIPTEVFVIFITTITRTQGLKNSEISKHVHV